MIYDYSSSEEVVAELLSKTKLSDASYADDMLLWLKEAIGFFRVRNSLVPTFKPVEIEDHVGNLPCGLITIDAITYNGFRLPHGTGSTDVRVAKKAFIEQNTDVGTYFVSDTESNGYTKNEQSYLLVRGDDIKPALSRGFCSGDYYIPYPRHIQTSFESGCVMIYYRKYPTDKEGYPLIPSESNCKVSMFWYLMAMLTLSGYKHHNPGHDYSFCIGEHERYKKAARTIMKTWSTDEKESFKNMWVNLIPPVGYYEKFGIGANANNGYTS